MNKTYRALKLAQSSLLIEAYHSTANPALQERISNIGLEIHNLAKEYFPHDFEEHVMLVSTLIKRGE